MILLLAGLLALADLPPCLHGRMLTPARALAYEKPRLPADGTL